MATQAVDGCDLCDGIFTQTNDSLDEVDAGRVFHVTDTSVIPYRYVIRDDSDVTPRAERARSYRMVHLHWGERLSPLMEGEGVLGLVTLSGAPLSTSSVSALAERLLTDLSIRHLAEPLRWDADHLLIHFPEVTGYTALADLFMNGKLDLGHGVKVKAIEPAILCNPPRSLIRVTSAKGHDLRMTLAEAVMPFSSAFTHLNIRVDQAAPAPPSELPCLGLTMLFDGANQIYAQRSLDRLAASPWQPVLLASDVMRFLDPGMYYFRNSLGGPLWGVKTGCPQPGVQITVFVQKRGKFDSMVEFYNSLFGTESVSREMVTTETSYRVFPLSTMSELMVAFLPGLKVVKSNELCLYIQARNLETMATVARMTNERHDGGNRVYLEDPEGTRVAVYYPLK